MKRCEYGPRSRFRNTLFSIKLTNWSNMQEYLPEKISSDKRSTFYVCCEKCCSISAAMVVLVAASILVLAAAETVLAPAATVLATASTVIIAAATIIAAASIVILAAAE
jgi:hypothetical protein